MTCICFLVVNVLGVMWVPSWIFSLLRAHGLWYVLIEEDIGPSSKPVLFWSKDDETTANNSVFYMEFYSWTGVLLRSACEEWRPWSPIFSLWKVYEACTVSASFSQRCFWEHCASLGQQKLCIPVLQEKLKDLDKMWMWWYFRLLDGLGSEMSQLQLCLPMFKD